MIQEKSYIIYSRAGEDIVMQKQLQWWQNPKLL